MIKRKETKTNQKRKKEGAASSAQEREPKEREKQRVTLRKAHRENRGEKGRKWVVACGPIQGPNVVRSGSNFSMLFVKLIVMN